jgi:hypothetical protein
MGTRVKTFLLGMLLGMTTSGLFLYAAIRVVEARGVIVHVQTEVLAAQVRQEVSAAVQRQLPGALSLLQREIPSRVAQQAGQQLAAARVQVGGFTVSVPANLIVQVKRQVADTVNASLQGAVTSADLERLAQEAGRRAEVLVRQRLEDVLAAQAITAKPLPWIEIPVYLRAHAVE